MLKVSHICKTFTGGIIRKTRVDAVKDVSFTICNGETFGIVGNSGCGKSTIANMLLSLIKPDSGTIEIDGTIQIIFQHPETSLDPAKKIGYSLEEPMIIHKMYDKAGRKKRVKELLDLVDLGEELLDRYPHQISGGEAQRIMIARALSLDPKILILDEPTSMLDVSVQAQIMTLLKELQEKLGLSYLFISHDLDVVRWFCDEIAVMEEGKFVETGRTEDVIGHPKAEFTKKLVENFILE
ncbi:MAG: ATP-binding cassette domain-containing protein [Lachnospiraceae bacterium]